MKPRQYQRQGFIISLVLHVVVLAAVLIWPLVFRSCTRLKKNEQLTFVEFTVSIPPPPAPETTEPPAPEPPKPEPTDDIKTPDPEKPPEVKKLEPPKPKDIRQTNRIVRKDFKAPPPKDKPLSEAEIARLLKMGARIGETTSVPDDDQIAMGAYFNKVRDRMYAVWQQPSQLASLPGLSTDVRVTVEPGGAVAARAKVRSSGNDLMDDSVMKAVNSVKALPPLPVGHRRPVDITITFELDN